MRKRILIKMLMAILLVAFAASAAMATPVWLGNKAGVKAEPIMASDGVHIQYIRYIFTHVDHKDTWHKEFVAYCADPLRAGCDANIPMRYNSKDGGTMIWDVPFEIIAGGQSAVNWAKEETWLNTFWLGLPDCQNLTVGKNLIYYNSNKDEGIPGSGGMHLLYIGPGAPFIPQPGDPNLFTCASYEAKSISTAPAVSVIQTPSPKKWRSQKKFRKLSNGIFCEEPCIKETLQNTREIKEDVKEIKTDVKDVKESVGPIDKTEPVDEQTLQQKTRKNLKLTKEVHKAVGTSKSGRSLHDKTGDFKRKNGTIAGSLEEIHRDVKEIKGALKIPETPQDKKVCLKCHTDGSF